MGQQKEGMKEELKEQGTSLGARLSICIPPLWVLVPHTHPFLPTCIPLPATAQRGQGAN